MTIAWRSAAARLGHARRRPLILGQLFWNRVDRSGGPAACWPWTGGRKADPKRRYGIFATTRNGRRVQLYAHRHALELTLGRPLRPGFIAMHSCDNPPCCNPSHLTEATQADN